MPPVPLLVLVPGPSARCAHEFSCEYQEGKERVKRGLLQQREFFDPKVVFRSAHRAFSPTARAKSRLLADAGGEKGSIAEAIERLCEELLNNL